jgi:two-component system chemotaxis response regulator CheB
MAEAVRALIVDDSAYMRVVLKDILQSHQGIRVVGSAKDGIEAIEKVKELRPDVVVLDIQMPRMDGIATLQRIMKEAPTRVVMLSAMDKFDAQLPLRALEMGAVDFISKPSGPVSIDIIHFSDKIVEIILTAAQARLDAIRHIRAAHFEKVEVRQERPPTSRKVIVIAASTGGPKALEAIFAALPKDIPTSLFVVQHIPPEFSESFVKRLNSANGPRVMLASANQRAETGMAYLAPGGRHIRLERMGATGIRIKLENSAPVNYVRPSADVLFKSAAECFGKNALAIILTGMGSDGARGARAIRDAGGKVIAQDEQTSLIYGMPKAAVDIGAADRVVSLDLIPAEIVSFLEEG